jgi:hypothetical protein
MSLQSIRFDDLDSPAGGHEPLGFDDEVAPAADTGADAGAGLGAVAEESKEVPAAEAP